MLHKIFDNGLVTTCKNKVTLMLNKPAYIGMCIWELSKVLMYKFHYDYIKNKYFLFSFLQFGDFNKSLSKYSINIVTTQGYYSQTLIV